MSEWPTVEICEDCGEVPGLCDCTAAAPKREYVLIPKDGVLWYWNCGECGRQACLDHGGSGQLLLIVRADDE